MPRKPEVKEAQNVQVEIVWLEEQTDGIRTEVGAYHIARAVLVLAKQVAIANDRQVDATARVAKVLGAIERLDKEDHE